MNAPQERMDTTAELPAQGRRVPNQRPAPAHAIRPGGLNRPFRGLIAVVELLLAAAAVWAAVWAWRNGMVTTVQQGTNPDGSTVPLEYTRYYGNWIAGAIGFGTLAGVLLLDALRQVALAARARSKRPRNRRDEPQLDG